MQNYLFARQMYMDKLKKFRGTNLIKVVSGIRRCGKSTLLKMFADSLRQQGIPESNIITLNLEEMENRHLLTAAALHDHLLARLASRGTTYIFLDEIQNVAAFEQAVDSLYVKDDVDLYITGSNAYFLSGELATLLTGRYVEIKMLPLSFSEYAAAFPDVLDKFTLYENYINHGSFPYVAKLQTLNPDGIADYLNSIYQTVVYKDIIARKDIKNEKLLEDIIKYVFDNIGNVTTPNRIADYLTSNGRTTNNHTVDSYLQALCDGFMLYRADRFDLRGKKLLQTLGKYYVIDPSFRRLLSSSAHTDNGRILENVVYLELLRRYQHVFIGKNDEVEVDFVAKKPNGKVDYYQVALTVRDESTLKRELQAFHGLDHYQKYLLTLDPESNDHNGITQINALNWLLES